VSRASGRTFFVLQHDPFYALGRKAIPEEYRMFEARRVRRRAAGGWSDSDPF